MKIILFWEQTLENFSSENIQFYLFIFVYDFIKIN